MSTTPEPIVDVSPELAETLRRATAMKILAESAKVVDRTTRDTTIDVLLPAYHDTGARTFRVDGFGLDGIATITLTANEASAEVEDEDAFVDWVEENYPTEVQYVTVVKKDWRTRFLKTLTITDDVAINPATKEPVPGVKVKPGGDPTQYSVKLNKDTTPAVTAQVIAGAVDHFNNANATKPAELEAGK